MLRVCADYCRQATLVGGRESLDPIFGFQRVRAIRVAHGREQAGWRIGKRIARLSRGHGQRSARQQLLYDAKRYQSLPIAGVEECSAAAR